MRVVICGAGTAGCVVAARLAQDPNIAVTLLEAGPHYRIGQWPAVLRHGHRVITETHTWEYRGRLTTSGRIVELPRGRVVGGSSATNGAVALRGYPGHYDEWNHVVAGYDWETWLPWFRLIERDLDFGTAPHHGDRGPIAISRDRRSRWLELQQRFADAAVSAGHEWIDDHNEPYALGVGPIPLNVVDGQRQTPADRYLDPALARGNLDIQTGVLVDRVRFRDRCATAVDVIRPDGSLSTVPADAVILALGTYATPAALLRSGVGPRGELSRHGIDPVAEIRYVGQGLQDHPRIPYRFGLDLPIPREATPRYQCLVTGAHEVAGETRFYQVLPYSGLRSGGRRVTDLLIQLCDPRSRQGRVRLRSRDPSAPPLIEVDWLRHPADRDAAIAAGRRLAEIAGAPSLATVLTPEVDFTDPDFPQRVVSTFHHPTGSCRMGDPADPEAVVDHQGRVLGIEGLWVMDASVIPRIPSANIHLAVLALAERLAATFPGDNPVHRIDRDLPRREERTDRRTR